MKTLLRLSKSYYQLNLMRMSSLKFTSQTIEKSKKCFNVYNPANGETIATIPDMNVDDAKEAVEKAKNLFESNEWSNMTGKARSELLKKWLVQLEKHREELSSIITAESGKPLPEAQGELTYGNSFIEWYAEEARRIYGEIVPSPKIDQQIFVMKQPIGVVAVITPWNFPHAMITRKVGAALAAGCTVVVKPSEDTPLTAVKIVELAYEAGIPESALSVITSSRENASEVGKFFCNSPDVAGISFTGSTHVGKILYQNSASTMKRLALELGGNAPFIVFDSADIDVAVKGAMSSKFRNCGQACVASNRFFVQEKIIDEFIENYVEEIKSLRQGNCLEDKTCTLGPLINEAQFKKVSGFVDDAISKGAKVLLGGKKRTDLGKLFYEPTVITNLKPNMKVYSEEVFGPIISIIPFKTEEEVIEKANNTRGGLAGYFFSQDIQQIFRVAKNLEVGMVGINEGMMSTAEAPFGGIKESGIGREGSKHGIEEFVHVKYICLGNLKF